MGGFERLPNRMPGTVRAIPALPERSPALSERPLCAGSLDG